MSRLFLVPASSAEAREHMEISLTEGVELARLAHLRGVVPGLSRIASGGRVYMWGATPGQMNRVRWERLEAGDVALVYSQGAFPLCARVEAKAISPETAKDIWGSDEHETWALMYFLNRPRPVNASLEDVRLALGYAARWVPQAFSFLGDDAEQRLVERYGGFEGFLDDVASSGIDFKGIAEPPEVEDAVEAVARVASRGRRQGRQMSAAVRKAVELRAMEEATAHYVALGWDVEDVSARESYDLLGRKAGERDLRVEVKGTTSSGAEVLLTRNEVANARAQHPDVALVVVSQISVDASGAEPAATGGFVRVVDPWPIDDGELAPLAFSYRLPTP